MAIQINNQSAAPNLDSRLTVFKGRQDHALLLPFALEDATKRLHLGIERIVIVERMHLFGVGSRPTDVQRRAVIYQVHDIQVVTRILRLESRSQGSLSFSWYPSAT